MAAVYYTSWHEFNSVLYFSLGETRFKIWEGEEGEKGKPFYLFAISSEQFLPKILPLKRRLPVKQIETSICVLSYCFLEILS